ncbi:MAG: Uma2 family endonuclease [Acidobacteriota bacterium]
MSIQLERRLFSVDEFHKMVESGILSEDDRVELIDGEILKMSPIGSRHAAYVDFIHRLFSSLITQQVIIRNQNPIYLDDHSEPQPDIAIVKYRSDFYVKHHPCVEDVLLIIEIAETSVEYDKEIKLPKYAESLIAEVFILNVPAKRLEVYRNPRDGKYQDVDFLSSDQIVSFLHFKEVEVRVEDFFIKEDLT